MRRAAVVCVLACAPLAAQAAGGHHGVDDADLVEPGRCEIETWASRGSGTRLLHGGLGCRVGPVELQGAVEHERGASAGRFVQAKWSHALAKDWKAGVAATANWDASQRPRRQGTTVVALLSWQVAPQWRLHANLGRDFNHGAGDEPRSGIAVEWSPPAFGDVTLGAERYRQAGAHLARAAVRWAANEHWTLDFSRTLRISGPGAALWTLAATYTFER